MHKSFWWILAALVPAVTLAAMTVSPRNLEKALVAQRALALEQPEDASVFNDLGNLLVLAGELEQAEAAYSRALELDPEKISTRFNLALLLQETGRFRDALQQYRKVLDLDPYHAWSYYQMGSLFDHWREDDLAVKYYAQAFSVDPQLAFPEVNPHVIDNRLLTEALLKAHSAQREIPTAPKTYDDPGRIAQLLVPPIPAEPAEGEEDAEEGRDEELAESRPEEGPESQHLSNQDLDPDAAANQAAPPSGLRRGSSYRPPSRFQRRPGNLRQFNQRRVPNTVNRPRTRTGGGRPLTTPGTVQRGTPQRGRGTEETPTVNPLADRPSAGSGANGRTLTPNAGAPGGGGRSGTSSTGRLEIRLDPLEPAGADDDVAAG